MTKENRFEYVRLMHDIMCSMNNENAYCSWIWIMPDCPSKEDIEYFAENEDEFKELEQTFIRLFKRYIKDGLFKPSEEEVEFANRFGIPFQIYN